MKNFQKIVVNFSQFSIMAAGLSTSSSTLSSLDKRPDTRWIGRSISFDPSSSGGMLVALEQAVRLGMGAVQIQLGKGNSTTKESLYRITSREAARILELRRRTGLYVVCHGKYVYNLATRKPWQIPVLKEELVRASLIGCDVVIHQGKDVDRLGVRGALDLYVEQVCEVVDWLLSKGLGNKLILENSSREGSAVGYSLEHLEYLATNLRAKLGQEKYEAGVGWCLDTCHAFVAGQLDTRNLAQTRRWLNRWSRGIGTQALSLVHFNDSNAKWDSHHDKHGCLLMGWIGNDHLGGADLGLAEVARWAASNHIPITMETPPGAELEEIELVRHWVAARLPEQLNKATSTYREKMKDVIRSVTTGLRRGGRGMRVTK